MPPADTHPLVTVRLAHFWVLGAAWAADKVEQAVADRAVGTSQASRRCDDMIQLKTHRDACPQRQAKWFDQMEG